MKHNRRFKSEVKTPIETTILVKIHRIHSCKFLYLKRKNYLFGAAKSHKEAL